MKICTGAPLNEHLIDTVFAIFDEDGDGLLSYKEFIAIMRVSFWFQGWNSALCDHFDSHTNGHKALCSNHDNLTALT